MSHGGPQVGYNSAYYPNRLDVGLDTGSDSMTRQEFADECDLNKLMARYDKAGVWPMMPPNKEPRYVDFASVPSDLQGTLEFMREAEDAFMQLPASVRREFDNDAAAFVGFATDGNNLEKLREWGLAAPQPAPDAPVRVEVVNPTSDPPAKP